MSFLPGMFPGGAAAGGAKFPEVIGAVGSNASGTGTSFAATLPSGRQVGDLLIGFAGSGANVGTTNTVGTPTGWTALQMPTQSNSAGFGSFYRFVAGGEADTISIPAGNSHESRTSAAVIALVRGVVAAPEIAGLGNVQISNSADPPQLTAADGDGDILWLAVGGHRPTQTLTGEPPDYHEVLHYAVASRPAILVSARELRAAVEDPGAFTWGTSIHRTAWTAALRGS